MGAMSPFDSPVNRVRVAICSVLSVVAIISNRIGSSHEVHEGRFDIERDSSVSKGLSLAIRFG